MFSQDSGLEGHTLDIFQPHSGPDLPRGGGCPDLQPGCRLLFLQILPSCVVPIQILYCSRSSGSLLILNRKYQTCLIFTIRCHGASDSKSCSSQWESAGQEAVANKTITQVRRNTTKEDQKHNTRQDCRLMTLIILNCVRREDHTV